MELESKVYVGFEALPLTPLFRLELSRGDPLEKEMATCSSILSWEMPWTDEPGGLQSMGLQTVGHKTGAAVYIIIYKVVNLLKN